MYGSDVRAWPEVHFAGIGWVPVDISIDRDRKPQPRLAKSSGRVNKQANSAARVPSPEAAKASPQLPKKSQSKKRPHASTHAGRWLKYLAIAVLPFVFIALITGAVWALKARRRRLRRKPTDHSLAIAGAWSEMVDRAADAGITVPTHHTRREARNTLLLAGFDGGRLDALLSLTERGTFHPAKATAKESNEAWHIVDELVKDLSFETPRTIRLRRFLSTAGLRRPVFA